MKASLPFACKTQAANFSKASLVEVSARRFRFHPAELKRAYRNLHGEVLLTTSA